MCTFVFCKQQYGTKEAFLRDKCLELQILPYNFKVDDELFYRYEDLGGGESKKKRAQSFLVKSQNVP